MAILMTLINIPLFIYSQSLVHRSATDHAQKAHDSSVDSHSVEEHAQDEMAAPSEHAANDHDSPAALSPAEIAAQALAEEEKPERFKSLANLYRPPLYGKCTKLFERFNRKILPDKPYKAFVYSFDGEDAYCADAYTDKGQQEAEEIVIRDCEEHHAGSGKYSPCRIYPAE